MEHFKTLEIWRVQHERAVLMPTGTKTFIFPIEDAEDGYADIEVNDFCKEVKALSMVLDRNNTKLIYRILYKVDYED